MWIQWRQGERMLTLALGSSLSQFVSQKTLCGSPARPACHITYLWTKPLGEHFPLWQSFCSIATSFSELLRSVVRRGFASILPQHGKQETWLELLYSVCLGLNSASRCTALILYQNCKTTRRWLPCLLFLKALFTTQTSKNATLPLEV